MVVRMFIPTTSPYKSPWGSIEKSEAPLSRCSRCDARMFQRENICRQCGHQTADENTGIYTRINDNLELPGVIATIELRVASAAARMIFFGVGAIIPVVGPLIVVLLAIFDLVLLRRGQHVGGRLFGTRVFRDTGEIAGFYQMWARSLASMLSPFEYWTALRDPYHRTWHDRLLGTYVMKVGWDVRELKPTSSNRSKIVFWLTAPLFVLVLTATTYLLLS